MRGTTRFAQGCTHGGYVPGRGPPGQRMADRTVWPPGRSTHRQPPWRTCHIKIHVWARFGGDLQPGAAVVGLGARSWWWLVGQECCQRARRQVGLARLYVLLIIFAGLVPLFALFSVAWVCVIGTGAPPAAHAQYMYAWSPQVSMHSSVGRGHGHNMKTPCLLASENPKRNGMLSTGIWASRPCTVLRMRSMAHRK